jgi:hypothetical protein
MMDLFISILSLAQLDVGRVSMKYILIVLALFAGPVAAETNWHRVTANSLLFVDMLQTVEISRNDKFVETNKYLGKHPTEREVYEWFLLSIIGNNLVGELLPTKYSDIYYTSVSLEHLDAVDQNIQFGINIKF